MAAPRVEAMTALEAPKRNPSARPLHDTVTLSADALSRGSAPAGREVMLKRLFNIEDATKEPRVETSVNDSNVNQNGNTWLNREDRAMLADAYDFANANGIDASQIDLLAFDLSSYRRNVHTGANRDSTGLIELPDGRPFIDVFSPEDESAAREVLSLKAMSDTKIDHGFLEVALDPGQGGSHHAVDFGVLRQLVSAFSPSYSDGSVDSSISFATRDARIELAKRVEASASPSVPGVSGRRTTADGQAIMMDRLFGKGEAKGTKSALFAAHLTEDDKKMLGGFYANAEATGADLHELDKLAEALGALRRSEAQLKDQEQLIPELALFSQPKVPHQNALDSGKFRDVLGKQS